MRIGELAFAVLPDGRGTLLHPDDLSFHELNPTGARIVAGLRDGSDVDALAERLAEGTDTPVEEVRAAVEQFLLELREAGFPIT